MGTRGLCVLFAVLACLPFTPAATARGGDGWREVQVRVVTIRYRTTDGLQRAAHVVLPAWYGPHRNPPLPLVISPHGRGVPATENVLRWGNLPALGGFAVVNPEGQGRRFARYSWGYSGQIRDLARMPRIVSRALPWLRVDRNRIFAFGASMGGQETLLLVARYPRLLAGAATFDAVADMARRYRDFGRLRCNRNCARRWSRPLGAGLRTLARLEIGGAPRHFPRRYAARSPITHARAIAASGVPLQLWWSRSDRVVPAGPQSARLARVLRRLNPVARIETFPGSWPHSAGLREYHMLIPALRKFGLFPTRTTAAVERKNPIHPLLPWHRAVRDERGRLLAWYRPNANLGYDRVLRLGWRFIERRVPIDPRTARKVYLNYAVFDAQTLRGIYWQHNPAFLNASFVDSVVAWYAYSGDRRAVAAVREMLDYQLAHGTTPARWAWPRVPFPTSCAGERAYGRCLAGLPRRFYGAIEPDKVGLLGHGYLLFYKLTGERKYLGAAVAAADALARHVRAGNDARTPWPFRVHARTGAVVDRAQFGGAVVGPVHLFDGLLDIGVGNQSAYRRARDLAWRWLLDHQLNRSSRAWNRWSGFYEDVPYNLGSRNQATPTLTAHYLLTHKAPETIDPQWQEHVTSMLQWVQRSFGRGPFVGAWGIDEQWRPGTSGCCSRVGLGSTTSRWAAAHALLFARTGDERSRELAVRSLNYSTYFAAADGRISCCGKRRYNTYWFSDGYADYLRSFNWAMAAMPELAPKRRDHLLGSTSVVQSVAYGKRRLTYRTFDDAGVETLRLSFVPRKVVGGEPSLVRPLGGGDYAVRIRRDGARRIQITG